MKFIIDMNLSPDWVLALKAIGHEAVHWSAVGAHDAEDTAIADHARDNGFVVVTSDLDFGKLLSAQRLRLPSVVQLRLGDLRPSTLLETVLRTITHTGPELEKGALVIIGASRVRILSLPLDGRPGEAP